MHVIAAAAVEHRDGMWIQAPEQAMIKLPLSWTSPSRGVFTDITCADSDPPARVVVETAAVARQTSAEAGDSTPPSPSCSALTLTLAQVKIDDTPSEPGRKPSIPPRLHNVRQQVRKDYCVAPPPPVRRKANARPSQTSETTNKRTREVSTSVLISLLSDSLTSQISVVVG